MGQVMDRDFVERRDESFYLVGSLATREREENAFSVPLPPI